MRVTSRPWTPPSGEACPVVEIRTPLMTAAKVAETLRGILARPEDPARLDAERGEFAEASLALKEAQRASRMVFADEGGVLLVDVLALVEARLRRMGRRRRRHG